MAALKWQIRNKATVSTAADDRYASTVLYTAAPQMLCWYGRQIICCLCSDADPLLLMREAKRFRKRKHRDQDGGRTTKPTKEQELVHPGKEPPLQEVLEGVCDLTEYRGPQLCKLHTLVSETETSMEEALHCGFLAIVAVNVKVLADR